MSTIAVVGLGAMGKAMAHNLLQAGHEVSVWNRSPGPVDELSAAGARPLRSPAQAFGSAVVFSVLADDHAVTETLLTPEILGAASGALHVNLATVSTQLADRATALHAEHGVGYVAAPVFGRVPVAQAGQLQVLSAGASDQIDRAQPFLDVIGARTWRLGDVPRQANVVKIIGNFLIASAIQSLSEAVSMAERSGVDSELLIDLLTSTLFQGPAYSSYGKLIATSTYQPAGFTTTLGRKDVGLALDVAADTGLRLPFGEVLRTVLDEALANGQADLDWSSIADLQRARDV
ncbi:NAD(P)-dependent oxidoreductase [Mycobacteroides chelonae]|uniref:NAD(P)-dependent oxidoreductase n=1 Tax=Mycobacteroides chelonae TaxID=1774 RepID=A0AB73TYV7_MYCCH|nr:NAD(P)-dependent oxidoreductase [Mycobacteroides chelonae]MBF9351956.1 NAD(P)-dependent oxidoreductase [Mycobacteroides chelonae]MEC4838863.1 NAD(P)-dependent oxidoreductase [Mycobacteroides chelonae]MEC4845028.1 NAD(P)-dependent oxidoreductase [Mycobacteroides chelonae]QDF69669.1 NAD(P)-dependent oxidoreductase [Mycobacteroides chelonae]QQG96070.1 NAD(P)-dependent oxidoreductase [Mycobacteroides chelonae]